MLLQFRRLALHTVPVLLLLSAVLTPMAYASPPDPSWIRGIYDDGDFDNVVVLITSAAGNLTLPEHGCPRSHVWCSCFALMRLNCPIGSVEREDRHRVDGRTRRHLHRGAADAR